MKVFGVSYSTGPAGGYDPMHTEFYIPRAALQCPHPMKRATQTYEHRSASFAWRASSFNSPSDYVLELTHAERDEILRAISALSIVGIVAPGATPRDLVNRIGADIARAVRSSDLTERMRQQGMEPIGSTPDQFDALIRAEIDKWAKVVKLSGATVD